MLFYHGASIGNLSELKPQISEHGEAYVYLTTDPVVALLYTVKAVEPPFNWYPYGFKDGIPVYTEYYPDAIADIYKGKRGYIYEFVNVAGIKNPTNIGCACVCTEPLKTGKVIEIPNVYEKLLEHEKNGELIIERYSELSEDRIKWIENTIKSEAEKFNLTNTDNSYSRFLKERFKDLF